MEGHVKRAFRKPKREEYKRNIRRHFDKENAVPGTSCSPPQKKRRSESSLTSTRVPLNFVNGNGGSSLVRQKMDNFFRKSFKGCSPVNKTKGSFGVARRGDERENNLQKERGKSVCRISVKPGCQDGTDEDKPSYGTGFVFVGNIIQTNFHVLRRHVVGNELKENAIIEVVFNYDDPERKEHQLCFTAEETLVACDDELDSAFLRLKPADKEVPPGLARHIAPPPESGEICTIGHPEAGVKIFESTQIIAPRNRMKEVNDHLDTKKCLPLTHMSISQTLKNQGIDKIMGGEDTDKVSTYHSDMFKGASGSPVFVGGNVFAMHTGAYGYGFEESPTYVFTQAFNQLPITESFVCKLKERGNVKILESLKLMAKDNPYLSRILEVEPMDVNW